MIKYIIVRIVAAQSPVASISRHMSDFSLGVGVGRKRSRTNLRHPEPEVSLTDDARGGEIISSDSASSHADQGSGELSTRDCNPPTAPGDREVKLGFQNNVQFLLVSLKDMISFAIL